MSRPKPLKPKLEFNPRNPAQQALKEAIERTDLVLAIGPAGSGKSHAAVALAVALHRCKRVRNIVFCRPAVGSEDLGAFPGTEDEKIAPYLRPLYTILSKVGGETYRNGPMIRAVSFATMRGETYEDCIVVIDEAQNATLPQLEMALTRLGEGSKMIVTGDPDQTDLPASQSGLIPLIHMLRGDYDIPTIHFTIDDTLRHKLVRKLTTLFAEHRRNRNGNVQSELPNLREKLPDPDPRWRNQLPDLRYISGSDGESYQLTAFTGAEEV